MGSLKRSFLEAIAAAVMLLALAVDAAAADTAEIKIGYLRRAEQRPAISLLDVAAPDAGLAGAELAIADNNTTGRFLNQKFSVADVKLGPGEDPGAAVQKLGGEGISLVVTDLPADALLKAADAGRLRGMLFFNAGAADDALRGEDCRAGIIHVAPSRSMLADGLAQYLVWKQWLKWVLVSGSHPGDKLFAAALKRAATRFGAKIVEEKEFEDKGGARQTDSGLAQVQRQIPLFTQGLPDHDVLLAADENAVFAAYLPYRTKGGTAGGGLGRAYAGELESINGAVGGYPAAKPLLETVFAPHAAARHAGMDGRAHDRRGRHPDEIGGGAAGSGRYPLGPRSSWPPSRAAR